MFGKSSIFLSTFLTILDTWRDIYVQKHWPNITTSTVTCFLCFMVFYSSFLCVSTLISHKRDQRWSYLWHTRVNGGHQYRFRRVAAIKNYTCYINLTLYNWCFRLLWGLLKSVQLFKRKRQTKYKKITSLQGLKIWGKLHFLTMLDTGRDICVQKYGPNITPSTVALWCVWKNHLKKLTNFKWEELNRGGDIISSELSHTTQCHKLIACFCPVGHFPPSKQPSLNTFYQSCVAPIRALC